MVDEICPCSAFIFLATRLKKCLKNRNFRWGTHMTNRWRASGALRRKKGLLCSSFHKPVCITIRSRVSISSRCGGPGARIYLHRLTPLGFSRACSPFQNGHCSTLAYQRKEKEFGCDILTNKKRYAICLHPLASKSALFLDSQRWCKAQTIFHQDHRAPHLGERTLQNIHSTWM
jgi:hypothetical protein